MSTLATIASPSPFLPVEDKGVPHFSPVLREVGTSRIPAVLKHIAQSERMAGVRPASRLEVRPKPEMVSAGVPELDALTGGIPRGCLAEICGGPSSGKTSVLLAAMAAATQRGESCVLIDASDSFDPSSGAAAGMDFSKLLWVRCGKSSVVVGRPSLAKNYQIGLPHPSASFAEGGDFDFVDVRRTTNAAFPANNRRVHERRLEQVLKSTDLVLQSGGFGLVVLDLAGISDKFVRRIPLASWFRFQRAVEHTKTALLVVSEIVCAQTCAVLVMKVRTQLSVVSYQPSRKFAGSRSLQPLSEFEFVCTPRKPSPGGAHEFSPALQRWEGRKILQSPVGTAEFSRANSVRPPHAEVLHEIQIEAEILRSRLECKPMQSLATNFMAHAVRAG